MKKIVRHKEPSLLPISSRKPSPQDAASELLENVVDCNQRLLFWDSASAPNPLLLVIFSWPMVCWRQNCGAHVCGVWTERQTAVNQLL